MNHPLALSQDASVAERHLSASVAERHLSACEAERHSSACEAEQTTVQPQPEAGHEDTPLTRPSLQDGLPPYHASYLADTAAAAAAAAAAAGTAVVAGAVAGAVAVAAVVGEYGDLQASAVLYIDLRSYHYLPYCSNVTRIIIMKKTDKGCGSMS